MPDRDRGDLQTTARNKAHSAGRRPIRDGLPEVSRNRRLELSVYRQLVAMPQAAWREPDLPGRRGAEHGPGDGLRRVLFL